MKIKITKLDKLVSEIVRNRAKGHCQRCGATKDFVQLQTAHCWGRRKRSVRWDLENCLALCWPCHRAIDGEIPGAKEELFIRYLGKKGYTELGQRANWPHPKPDLKVITIYLESLLKKVWDDQKD